MMAVIQKLVKNFTEADIDDEIILMRLDNGELLSLTDSAAAVWRLIDGNRDRAALAAALTEQFAAEEQQIAKDIAELLSQLKNACLVAEG